MYVLTGQDIGRGSGYSKMSDKEVPMNCLISNFRIIFEKKNFKWF